MPRRLRHLPSLHRVGDKDSAQASWLRSSTGLFAKKDGSAAITAQGSRFGREVQSNEIGTNHKISFFIQSILTISKS